MQFTHFLTAYISIVLFVLGTVIGSFLNVLIYRLPLGLKFDRLSDHSFCPNCKHRLYAKDLFPLFSWLFLRGKCRYCKAPISPRYPIVEALNGVMYVLAYVVLCGGATEQGTGLSLGLLGYMAFFSALLVAAWVDAEHQIIPDSQWIVIFVAGLLLAGDKLIAEKGFTPDFVSFIISRGIGLVAVSGLFFLIALVTGGRAMGGGDIKLMAAVGFVLGWKAVVVALFAAAILGALFALLRKLFFKKKMRGVVPFGPFLAAGSALCAFVGEAIFDGYLDLFL